MNAAALADALGGRKAGSSWMARCPAHDDRTPSLSIGETPGGRLLVHCHAGCDQASVIKELRLQGLWPEGSATVPARSPAMRPSARRRGSADDENRTSGAMAIWRACPSANGSLAARYLAGRGLRLPLPPTLRYHPGLRHRDGSTWPALVALVSSGADNRPLAIHRTFLARDGAGKAPVTPARMMFGPCRGGVVRLAAAGAVLMVGEGIETCLAAMQASGHPAWAALSTSGLRSLDLPQEVREVIVLADGDDAGDAAARHCARRWKGEGRRVRIARPPGGMDFNDVLLGRRVLTAQAGQSG